MRSVVVLRFICPLSELQNQGQRQLHFIRQTGSIPYGETAPMLRKPASRKPIFVTQWAYI